MSKYNEWSRYGFFATKQRWHPRFTELPANILPMRVAFGRVDLVIGKDSYSGTTFFPRFFFYNIFCLFFFVDSSRACISCATTEDLSSGSKLHMYLEWPGENNINDNRCGLVYWDMLELVHVNSIACNVLCRTRMLLALHNTFKRFGCMNIFNKSNIREVKDMKLMHHIDP